MKRLGCLSAAVALAIALALPSASTAEVRVLLNDGEGGTLLAEFASAKCQRGVGKRANSLKFTATAISTNGYRLSVDLFGSGNGQQLAYGGPSQISFEGPAGVWSSLISPPNAPPGGGAVSFNASKTRIGVGFSPMFDQSMQYAVAVAGGMTCKYPRKKRGRRG